MFYICFKSTSSIEETIQHLAISWQFARYYLGWGWLRWFLPVQVKSVYFYLFTVLLYSLFHYLAFQEGHFTIAVLQDAHGLWGFGLFGGATVTYSTNAFFLRASPLRAVFFLGAAAIIVPSDVDWLLLA